MSLLIRLGVAVLLVLLAAHGLGVLPPRLPLPELVQAAGVLDQARGADAAAVVYDAVASRVAELRGLTPRQPVQRTVLTAEQFRARLIDDLNKEDSLESIENSRKLMVALGLLAPDVDLYSLELEFRSGVVLGQYDPETKQLYVISSATEPGPLERVTYAHEYTHALQDQYYDIRALMPKNSDNSDRDLAISALLEGDALIIEEMYQTQAMTRAEREEKTRQERALGSSLNLDRLPLVILEETYFPYQEGPRFIVNVLGRPAIQEALQNGTGYGPRINRLFENPPKSSAQILHPEKYLNGIDPVEVRLPDLAAALGEDWKQLRTDLLGEIDHRILIQQFLSRDLAERAAAGWAGDRFALLGRGDEVAVVVSSRWESAADAQEWFDAYAQAVRARYGSRLAVADQRANRIVWRTPDGLQLLSVAGTSTTILIAQTPEQIASLERALGASEASGLGPAGIPAPAAVPGR
ncbi:MAG TPA: hypothetical protein VFB73_06340 [Chloroflexota bacterium]|nr:hypothetical protein [Chloroflexota bacterium]